MQPTRRDALVTIAALAAASPAEAQQTFLSQSELDWLAVLVDTIIPRTDTPGASDAGVPVFIDRRLSGNPQLAALFREGMKELEAAGFAAATEERRIELLTPRQNTPFFRAMKGLTVDGYYTSEAGLTQELGWHGNSFLPEFKGCTHPEHQK
jgi:hypothetical protein